MTEENQPIEPTSYYTGPDGVKHELGEINYLDAMNLAERLARRKLFLEDTIGGNYVVASSLSRRVNFSPDFLTAIERAQKRAKNRRRNAEMKQRKLARKRAPKTFGRNK